MRRRWVAVVVAGAAAWCGPPAAGGAANAVVAGAAGALTAGGLAGVASVSCPSAGNCAAGGSYRDGAGRIEAFVVSERTGRWGRAVEVPGSGALNVDGDAELFSVSCVSAGNCAAGGLYVDASGHVQALVVSERNGRWGKAIEVPGSGALNRGGDGYVDSVSCGSGGSCAAGGFFTDGAGHSQAFVSSERDGRWGRAVEVPG